MGKDDENDEPTGENENDDPEGDGDDDDLPEVDLDKIIDERVTARVDEVIGAGRSSKPKGSGAAQKGSTPPRDGNSPEPPHPPGPSLKDTVRQVLKEEDHEREHEQVRSAMGDRTPRPPRKGLARLVFGERQ